MSNDELLEQILKRFDTLEQGQRRLEQGQAQVNTIVAQIKTGLETLEAGQKDIREELATKAEKADIHDLKAEVVRKIKQHDKRIDALEEKVGISNPYKN